MWDWLLAHDYQALGAVYRWRPALVWAQAAADVVIGLASFSIPLTLAYFSRKPGKQALRRAWQPIAALALLSGGVYLIDAATLWLPLYPLVVAIKVLTALAFVATVPVVVWLILNTLKLRSPAELEAANEQLRAEMEMRRATEQELREAHEAALAASRAKSGFLANMSHEIRTPMNAVMGMTAALLNAPLSQQQREIAETIRASGESLLSIINDVLDLSKIEAGAVSAEEADLHLDEVVERAALTMAERAQAKGLELVAAVDHRVPPNLRGDARRLHQVLMNLTSNAVKFTDRGEVEVRAMLEAESEAEVRVRFSVRDTGIGIVREARERLFQPFMQADASTTRKFGGTGLGLAISKRLVEVMGGEIYVDSHTGRGSTFYFTVALKKGAPASAEELAEAAKLRGLRALLVDDNATSRQVLAEQLEAWGLKVDQATDAGAALEKIAPIAHGGESPYRFAVIDRGLPGTGGLELARRLKQVPALAAMHVILLHNMVSRDATAALQGAGVAAALVKPTRQSLLLRTLTTLLTRGPMAAPIASPPKAASVGPVAALPGKWKILVAEDNALNQQVIRLQLAELGQQADFAADGLEVLAAVQRNGYDLVLMDCQMPGLDGYDATTEIRRREAGGAHLWIVATTAHAMVGDRDRCLASGMDDYIAKPISIESLRAALERFAQRAPAIIERGAAQPPVPAPAAAPAAAGPRLDFSRLQKVARGNSRLLRQLADVYITQTADQLAMLRAALSKRSALDVERIAHRCAGSSATVGMDSISDLFSELEQTARKGQLEPAESLVANIESAFVRVRALAKELPAAQ